MSFLYVILLVGLYHLFINKKQILRAIIESWKIRYSLRNLNPSYYFVHNFMLPKEKGQPILIHHLVLTRKGIFIINIVPYNGNVYGHEYQSAWTVFQSKERQYTILNPTLENNRKIGHLQQLFHTYQLPCYNVVVFPNQAQLRISTNSIVIHENELTNTIKTHTLETANLLTVKEFFHIKRRLSILHKEKTNRFHPFQLIKKKGIL